jgi:hypothetical protein
VYMSNLYSNSELTIGSQRIHTKITLIVIYTYVLACIWDAYKGAAWNDCNWHGMYGCMDGQ